MKKPVIAILADFPLFKVNAAYQQKGWYYKVWLLSLYQTFCRCADYEVHWLVYCRRRWRYHCFSEGGQTFHVLPAMQGTFSQYLNYRTDIAAALRVLQKIQPDIVHAWGTETRYAVAAAAYRGKAYKILSMQGILTAYLARSPMPTYYHRQVRFEVPSMERFDLITAESDWGCARCREMVPTAHIVPWEYAVHSEFFDASRSLSAHPVCVLAGTAEPIKNLRTAIEAFSRPELAHIELLMAGAEPARFPDLPPNIRALGGVAHEKMVQLLSRAWGLVHPSLADTSPNIVKEARVMGLPVVVSDDCGGAQYVEHGRSGFIISSRDTEALVQGALQMMRDRKTSLDMGAYGQAQCRQLLSPETMETGLRKLYEEALKSKIFKG